jgi:uncharacterized membrane protein YfcA
VTVAQGVLAAGAGFLAGAINAVAGGGSLISFPALVAIGYPSLTANVTNAVAVLPGYVGGSLAYRRELSGQQARARLLGAVTIVGALAGAAVLLAGSEAAFELIAPFLVLVACVLLALQPRLARMARRRRQGANGEISRGALVGQFVVSVYGGYFGAGLGIMMMAVLGMFLEDGLHEINALKGLLSLIVGVAAAFFFAVLGPVAWGAAGAVAVGSLAGGHAGVGLARRLSSDALRAAVIVFGLAAATYLLIGAV